MFGKIFSSMYSGSLVGKGSMAFALLGYVIANMRPDRDVDCQVELNPRILAVIFGEPEEEVNKAIEFLCSPDPDSRSPECDGRRLIRVGQFDYRVVNGAKYRAIRDDEERRAMNRDRQANYRESNRMANDPDFEANFSLFWANYPRKVSKVKARIELAKALRKVSIETILAAIERHRTTEQWMRDGGKYIPYPKTWLNQQRWQDDLTPPEDMSSEAVIEYGKLHDIPASVSSVFFYELLGKDTNNWQVRLLAFWKKIQSDQNSWHLNPKLNSFGPHNITNWRPTKKLEAVIQLSNGRWYDVNGNDPLREQFSTAAEFEHAKQQFVQRQCGI